MGFIAAHDLGLAAAELVIKFDDAAATGMIAVSNLVFGYYSASGS